MQSLRRLLLAALLLLSASLAFAVDIASADLESCNVLLGKEKVDAFQRYMQQIKISGDAGNANLAYQYAGILHNRFICHEEIILGDQPWTITTETKGSAGSETRFRPTAQNLQNYPEAFAALKAAVAAFTKIAEKDLRARTSLGQYYADYSDVLKPSQEGYFYLASAYESYCSPENFRPESKSRCRFFKHYKTSYLGLITVAERDQIDRRARVWSDAFMRAKATQ